jgi:uncharacterized membrane protein
MPIRKIAFTAVVAAVYAVLTMVLAPISYGPVQFRVSEVLCILPFFFPFSVWGLFVGCIISNLISAYGVFDVVFGSLATLLAALITMQLGRGKRESIPVKALACLPPVIFNGIIVGAVIAYGITSVPGATESFLPTWAVVGLQVALGELGVLYVLGLPAMILLPKTGFFRAISALYSQELK